MRPPSTRRILAGVAMASMAVASVVVAAQSAQAATAAFVKTQSWDTGYEGKFTITNNTSTTITSWNVQFDLPSGTTLGTYWDALVTTSGQHVTATNREYNGTLGPNASTSFGFVASGTGSPTNCTVNGSSCSGGGNPGGPGAPSNLRVTGTTNTSISLAWNASSGTVSGYRVYEGSTQRAQVTGLSATISNLAACSSHAYTVRAFNANGESANSNSVSATTGGCTGTAGMAAAPYLYLGWGNPPPAQTVMSATGVRWFTMAFVLSGGGCTPEWDGNRPLTGGVDAQNVNAIRAGGGDIIPSFGGWSGNKLGPNCSTPQALANAYQQVIDAYRLRAIDIDIENTDEFENPVVMDRILGALRIIKQNNPGVTTIITFPTTTSGPSATGVRLINQARALNANIDVFTIMPFDFGCSGSMVTCTQSAMNGLRSRLMSTFGWDAATANRRMGMSGMNGRSDVGEITSVQDWQQIKDWAQGQRFARFSFWSVNRDRANGAGVPSSDWSFTRITAQFRP